MSISREWHPRVLVALGDLDQLKSLQQSELLIFTALKDLLLCADVQLVEPQRRLDIFYETICFYQTIVVIDSVLTLISFRGKSHGTKYSSFLSNDLLTISKLGLGVLYFISKSNNLSIRGYCVTLMCLQL